MIDKDAVYKKVAVYDPSRPEGVKQVIVESYWQSGQDITARIVTTHTTILAEVMGLKIAIAMLRNELRGPGPHHQLDYMEQIMLPRAIHQLERFESDFRGINRHRGDRFLLGSYYTQN